MNYLLTYFLIKFFIMKKFIFPKVGANVKRNLIFLLSFNMTISAQCVLTTDELVEISLSETDCTATLTDDMFLSDDGAGCIVADHYEFEVKSGSTVLIARTATAVIDASFLGGPYSVKIWAVNASGSTLNTGTSSFTVVDEVNPTIGCYLENFEISGEITTSDPLYYRTNSSTTPPPGNCTVTGRNVYYDVFEFTISQTDTYTFSLDGSDPGASGTAFFAALYKGGFDPNDPCTDLISDTYAGEPTPANGASFTFSELLDEPGTTYYLVTTTVDVGDVGIYTWSFSSISGEGLFTPNNTCTYNVYCNESLDNIGILGFDNCGNPVTIVHTDQSIITNICGPNSPLPDTIIKQINRKYFAVDASANVSDSIEVTINVCKIPLAEWNSIQAPQSYTCQAGNQLSCSTVYTPDLTYPTHPSADEIGWPTMMVNGIQTVIGTSCIGDCGLNVTYSDLEVSNTCTPCTKRILRTWIISETCCIPRVLFRTQTIDIADFTPPDLTCPADVTVNTNQFNCYANYKFPKPTVSDNCQLEADFEWDIAFSNPNMVPQPLIDNANLINTPTRSLGEGLNTVTYTVYDGCGNFSTCTYTVTVVDKVPPVAICQQFTVAALTYNGDANLPATTVNSGSYDNCSNVSFKIKKMGSSAPFSDYVSYDCSDINQSNVVILQVLDEALNEGTCMVNVELQDKLPPSISCPAGQTVNCDYPYDPQDLTKYFGFATAHDNCNYTITTDSTTNNFACYSNPVKVITRTFTATDDGQRTATCTQTINFVKNVYFGYIGSTTTDDANGQIKWPDTVKVNTCMNPNSGLSSISPLHPNQSGYPVLEEYACDAVGFTYSDFVFVDNDSDLDNDEACFKIIRTWTVIDDCHKVNGTFARWSHDQILLVTNSVDPVLVPTPDKTVCTLDSTCMTGEIELVYTASDDCTQNEDLRWRFKLDYGNDNALNVWDSISPIFTGATLNASGEYEIGTHKILWEVWDQCGNHISREQLFTIMNCKKPTPICFDQLSVDLTPMPGGAGALVHAYKFNNKSFHTCGYDLLFSFSSNVNDTTKMYYCNEKGNQPIELWVTALLPDGSTTQDFCTSTLRVEDNNNLCPPVPLDYGLISGTIMTEDSRKLNEMSVRLAGSEYSDVKTNSEGKFEFPPVLYGSSYTVVPNSTNDYMNGLSTLDIVLMQKHILGIKKYNSPYNYIASDINKDNKITASDILQIRKLILGEEDEFESNSSWRFIYKTQGMDDNENPLNGEFSETLPFNDLNSNLNADFVAVKVGDINGDAVVNGLDKLETRTTKAIGFVIDNEEFEKSNIVEIPVLARDFNEIIGFQGTFRFNSDLLEFVSLVPAGVESKSMNIAINRLENGLIPISCNFNFAENIADDEVLFVLKFNAKKNGQLVNNLSFSSDITRKEAYGSDYEIEDINMVVRSTTGGFELFQNEPNPFTYDTDILFNIDKAETYTFTIYDVTGKMLYEQTSTSNIGINKITVNNSDLNTSGVLYYSIRTKDYSATKKMVVLK